ncbi:unnamed protein product [Cylicocyclus nassatus]|uniref:Uncharacterized protein n=1 Tax=Cylicocyclus nassatus TaxID=53992 RepID=A0AA36GM65_CYLNA|nr:unnamed protein product [Cylicocyclus nassatus]
MTIWRTKTRRGEPVSKSHQYRGRKRSYSKSPSTSSERKPARRAKRSESPAQSELLAEVIHELAITRAPEPSRSTEAKPPVPEEAHTRAPTMLELISAIANGRDVTGDFPFQAEEDSKTTVVPREYRPAVQLLHQMTMALSTDYIFSSAQLSHADLVALDNFIHKDFFEQVQVKSIHPQKRQEFGDSSSQLSALLISGSMEGLVRMTADATNYLQELSHRPQPGPEDIINCMDILFTNIYNINFRRYEILREVMRVLYLRPEQIQSRLDLLAKYDLTFRKLETTIHAANLIVAQMSIVHECYRVVLKEQLQVRGVVDPILLPLPTAVTPAAPQLPKPRKRKTKPKPQPVQAPQLPPPQPPPSILQHTVQELLQRPSTSTAYSDLQRALEAIVHQEGEELQNGVQADGQRKPLVVTFVWNDIRPQDVTSIGD